MQSGEKQIRTTSRPRCFLCGAEGKLLYEGLTDPFFDAPGTWSFRQCPERDCGLVWLDPVPAPEDLHVAYQQYFTHETNDGKQGNPKRLRNMLYKAYELTMAVPAAVVGLHNAKHEAQRMFLNDVAPGKLLDVGCGDGLFLSQMRQQGWSVDGVDFDPKAIESAKTKFGLDLRHGDLAGARFPDNRFDAVTLKHVIEHVPDPIALLHEVRRILKPDGRAVVTTPNSQSLGHQMLGQFWFGLDQPRHLQVFSVSTLRECGKRAGLKVLEAKSTAANADVFVGGSYSIRDAKDHRSQHQPPPSIGRTLKAVSAQFREHKQLRTKPDVGEEAVLICTKE